MQLRWLQWKVSCKQQLDNAACRVEGAGKAVHDEDIYYAARVSLIKKKKRNAILGLMCMSFQLLIELVVQCYSCMAERGLVYGALTDYEHTWLMRADTRGGLQVSKAALWSDRGHGYAGISATEVRPILLLVLGCCSHGHLHLAEF